jgi:hypothetical protein
MATTAVIRGFYKLPTATSKVSLTIDKDKWFKQYFSSKSLRRFGPGGRSISANCRVSSVDVF